MFERLTHTEDDATLALLRIVLGIVFFAHGAQKALAWFGGPGFQPTVDSFVTNLGIPWLLAIIAIAAEFLGGIALLLGFLGRVAAILITIEMVVAVALVHLQRGFFMNWFGTKQGEGYEFHLLAVAMLITIAVRGSGAWSIDLLLTRAIQGRIRPVQARPA
jgi:putative oxidoreductase